MSRAESLDEQPPHPEGRLPAQVRQPAAAPDTTRGTTPLWALALTLGIAAACAAWLIWLMRHSPITTIQDSYAVWISGCYSMYLLFQALSNYGQNSDYWERQIDYRAAMMLLVALALTGLVTLFWLTRT